MKGIIYLSLMFGLTCVASGADTLQLRDGRTFVGQFLGATRTEIWFQRELQADVPGTLVFPVGQVATLVFDPAAKATAQQKSVPEIRDWIATSGFRYRAARLTPAAFAIFRR